MDSVVIHRASTPEEMAGLRALRLEVFVREQGVKAEEELDSLDQAAIHAVAWDGREVVATGRLVLLSSGEAQIGRMAVRAVLRRAGIGSDILRFLEEEAQAQGLQRIILHAQTYVVPFYRQHGYRQEGVTFQEAGIEHILMRKTLF
jgi:predicted GNAT family N-acyltransferase